MDKEVQCCKLTLNCRVAVTLSRDTETVMLPNCCGPALEGGGGGEGEREGGREGGRGGGRGGGQSGEGRGYSSTVIHYSSHWAKYT